MRHSPHFRGTRDIRRISRLFLPSGAIAPCSAIDLSYWMQSIVRGNYYGVFKRDGFDATTPPPLAGPFSADHWEVGCSAPTSPVCLLWPARRGWSASDHQAWLQQSLPLDGGSVPPHRVSRWDSDGP